MKAQGMGDVLETILKKKNTHFSGAGTLERSLKEERIGYAKVWR